MFNKQEILFRKLVTKCPSLKHLELGRSISLADVDIMEILSKNSLKYLQSFSLKESLNAELSIFSIETLIENCPDLKSITEIRYVDRTLRLFCIIKSPC